jgi:hypothetical protein
VPVNSEFKDAFGGAARHIVAAENGHRRDRSMR